MDAFLVSLVLVCAYLTLTLLKMKRFVRKDRESMFNRRLSEIPHRQRVFEVAPELYREIYQERPWDDLDREIDKQIRAGQEINENVLKRVFLRKAAA